MGLALGKSWRCFAILALILVTTLPAWSAIDETVSQSPSYVLVPTTLDAAGGPSMSAGSRLTASLGQEIVVGASSSPHFVVQSGFWGFSGTTLVPVVLAATKVPAQPGVVDLAWSGNNSPYDIYRNTNCASVFSSTLATTSNNAYADAAAPSGGLTCYNVLATAPGPIAPRNASAP